MKEDVKRARILIGGDSGCAGYTQEEKRILNEILGSRVSVRNMIVHNALRIVCQAILEDPDRGCPGSLMELRASFGGAVSNPVVARSAASPAAKDAVTVEAVDAEASAVDDTPDWLAASSKASPSESEIAREQASPPKEEDPERALMRSRAQSFIG
ncbi:hypothetical protein [Marinobacter nauticus]|uniref:Uncharacterized protein n=1 Tax=Marinobacter nauticus (strain ATCC 700491 / DSM 11845 / VT8) TaxID=351348 RepID=A1U809_MARN8|nr:hypothetical protein [Marinobacter nauticus]ABM21128.1 hypothetical protein Maqu_4277 [Marinobacter nauticus VT8]